MHLALRSKLYSRIKGRNQAGSLSNEEELLLRIGEMTHEDIESLLRSYNRCVMSYHPENYHQERGTLLRNFEMLRRYGLTDDDYSSIDFC